MKKRVNKISKGFLALVCVAILLIWNTFTVFAINFDFDEVSKSVFVIAATDDSGYEIAEGSGFAVHKNYIVTNAHVVAGKNNIAIGSYSENTENNIGDIYLAQTVAIDENIDIAVLRVEGLVMTPLKMADASTIKEGDDAYAIGTPEGLPYTLTKGTISSKLRTVGGVRYVQTDVGITYGNSGGPLLNEDGEVIGINTSGSATSESIRFAIRVDEVIDYLNANNIYLSGSGTETPSSTTSTMSQPSDKDDEISYHDPYDEGDYSEGGDFPFFVIPIVLIASAIAGVIVVIIKLSSRKSEGETYDIPINNQGTPNVVKNPVVPNAVQRVNEKPVAVTGVRVLTGSMTGTEYKIDDGKTAILGKDSYLANLVFDSSYLAVSRLHCTVTYSEKYDKYFVTDSSSNGTYYENGARLNKGLRTPVNRGMILRLADSDCKIKLL